MVGDLPRLVDEQDVVGGLAVRGRAQQVEVASQLVEDAELVDGGDDHLALGRDLLGRRRDGHTVGHLVRELRERARRGEEADSLPAQRVCEGQRERPRLLVGERDDRHAGAALVRDRLRDEALEDERLAGSCGGLEEDAVVELVELVETVVALVELVETFFLVSTGSTIGILVSTGSTIGGLVSTVGAVQQPSQLGHGLLGDHGVPVGGLRVVRPVVVRRDGEGEGHRLLQVVDREVGGRRLGRTGGGVAAGQTVGGTRTRRGRAPGARPGG